MAAPVCKISPPNQISQPPQVQFPAFPQPNANNLQSLVNAILALQQAMQQLLGQFGTRLTGPSQGIGGGMSGFSVHESPSSSASKNQNQPQQGVWQYVSAVTSQHKITNPTDPEQFVTIQRIDGITYRNTVTGQTLTINTSGITGGS